MKQSEAWIFSIQELEEGHKEIYKEWSDFIDLFHYGAPFGEFDGEHYRKFPHLAEEIRRCRPAVNVRILIDLT